jgi:DNA invertase Pin-like site-specific DNA recombinase
MMGVFAEFERSMIVERVRAGVARAKASGTKSGKAFGRPLRRLRDMIAPRFCFLGACRMGPRLAVPPRVQPLSCC